MREIMALLKLDDLVGFELPCTKLPQCRRCTLKYEPELGGLEPPNRGDSGCGHHNVVAGSATRVDGERLECFDSHNVTSSQ